ncbi:MAG: hypothetical protein ACN4GZ_17175 [Acidimicrobiales bacterium]
MKVPADFVCEHGMPQPWVTCTDCMLLPHDRQPKPPTPEPVKVTPAKRAPAKKKARVKRSKTGATSSPRQSTRLPKTETDPIPMLVGDKDLAYEIPDTNLRYHVQGTDSGWLSISTMPKELRESGWVYLQTGRKLVARCRVKGIGFRQRRWSHEKPGDTADAGPGGTIEVFDDGWEFVSIDLGVDGDKEVSGYRYVITDPDDSVRVAVSDDGV